MLPKSCHMSMVALLQNAHSVISYAVIKSDSVYKNGAYTK